MIYVPSFWWHEVTSTPGPRRRDGSVADGEFIQLNAAINRWFDPLYLKEFPCATCAKYVNKKYTDMLYDNLS